MRRLAIAGLLSVLALTSSAAQKRSIIALGLIYRYHGDTIWIERDTTIRRTIFHGDTIIKTWWLNDIQRSSLTYVAVADSARMISAVDDSGRSVAQPIASRAVPLRMLTLDRWMLESQLRMQETMANVAALGVTSSLEPPVFSETARTYGASSTPRLVQFRDTVKYIRGCPGAAQADTTIFVLFKSDSLKRIRPERMFGQAMAVTILGEMRMAITQERMSARTALPSDLPRAPQPCR